MSAARWIDLWTPDEAALRAALPPGTHDITVARLLRPIDTEMPPRPRLEARDGYVFGILVAPGIDGRQGSLEEIGVIITADTIITVHTTPRTSGSLTFDAAVATAARGGTATGLCLYTVVDEIAERFLAVIDRFEEEIDELEDHITEWPSAVVRSRISETRHDILHVRRILTPTRDAARSVLDGRVDPEGPNELFPREVELHFADAYDKLLRATDALDLTRDLLAGVRDFHQAEMANEQNEVTKRLTAVASILLVPTFIVGLYGQNFRTIPEYQWRFGYLWSWFLIVASTVGQVWYFRRRRWL
ncbi:MAG: magnesium transporter CorA family protein [Actinomycetota bacterium]